MTTFVIQKPLTYRAKLQEEVREQALDVTLRRLAAERGEEITGVESKEMLRKADAVLGMKGQKGTPTMHSAQVASPARVRGESYQIDSDHINAHGDRVLTMSRPVGGGRFETIQVRESQAEAHTWVSAEVRGGRAR